MGKFASSAQIAVAALTHEPAFLPRSVLRPEKVASRLTMFVVAPKKKEQQKMSLGDFLGDQCTPPAPIPARVPETDRLQRWDHGLMRWRMRQFLVSCTHKASLADAFTN